MNTQPLADRIRPKTLDDMVGQQHLVGPNGVVRRMLDKKRIMRCREERVLIF